MFFRHLLQPQLLKLIRCRLHKRHVTIPTTARCSLNIPHDSRQYVLTVTLRSLIASINKFGDRSVAVAGPRLWNSLPISLRQISSYGQFRRYLKNHLFGMWEITAQCDTWLSTLYKYSYLLTYLLSLTCRGIVIHISTPSYSQNFRGRLVTDHIEHCQTLVPVEKFTSKHTHSINHDTEPRSW